MFGKTGENHPMYGRTHSVETKALMCESHKGETHSEEAKARISEALKGRTAETLAKLSEAKKGENHPFFGKTHSAETISKISIARGGGTVYVYNTQGLLINCFSSARKAGLHFDVTFSTIFKYAQNGQIF